jgi:hypothetical protein
MATEQTATHSTGEHQVTVVDGRELTLEEVHSMTAEQVEDAIVAQVLSVMRENLHDVGVRRFCGR